MSDGNAAIVSTVAAAAAAQFHQVSLLEKRYALYNALNTGVNVLCNTNRSSMNNSSSSSSSSNSSTSSRQETYVSDNSSLDSSIDSCLNNTSTTSGSTNLTATMSFIRNNVTRVLNMYFKNVSDEYGYGAAITTTTTTQINNNNNNFDTTTSTITTNTPTNATLYATAATTTTSSSNSSSNRSLIGDNAMLNAVSTLLQTQLTNGSNDISTTTTTNLNSSSTLSTASTWSTPAAKVLQSTMPSIVYPTFGINNYENCSTLFMNFTKPQEGIYCNYTWDQFLCWPPTPAGVLARMHCPAGFHGIDTNKFANRKCELSGHWGSRPNETYNPHGWTDYQPCFKPEVFELIQKVKNLDIFLEIAQRTRVLEIVGLILSFFALIISLIIFYNFRSLRNNRTKIHKNLFIAMVLQVLVRLTLYLDQAFRRGKRDSTAIGNGSNGPGIENTPYICEASYILLEYARTAMFMWMFIEGLYLHNMITVAVFQGRFPHTVFSLLGWGLPIIMTTIWALCTAIYTNSVHDCFWNYNLTPYYWILEGPRLVVIVLNFFFLMNIIRVLVMKLRQSQASDIEQTRKAVRAAIVLLPLLGITNLLHLVPALNEPWKFALWSYVTHFLTSFQGFFIALIYCFLNGEVRAVLLKSAAVYMSVRGHPEWMQKRASLYSGAYNTAPDTEGQLPQDDKTNDSTNNKRAKNVRKTSTIIPHQHTTNSNPYTYITTTPLAARRTSVPKSSARNQTERRSKYWMFTFCFRGPKVLGVPADAPVPVPPESVVFELSEQ